MSELSAIFAVAIKGIENDFNRRKAEDKAQIAKLEARIVLLEARLNEPGSASQPQVVPISGVNPKSKSKKEKNNARAKKKRDEERRNCGCGGITSIDVERALVHEGSGKHNNWLKANNLCLPAVDPEEEDDSFSCLSEEDEEL
jgi:hypothetical protein